MINPSLGAKLAMKKKLRKLESLKTATRTSPNLVKGGTSRSLSRVKIKEERRGRAAGVMFND